MNFLGFNLDSLTEPVSFSFQVAGWKGASLGASARRSTAEFRKKAEGVSALRPIAITMNDIVKVPKLDTGEIVNALAAKAPVGKGQTADRLAEVSFEKPNILAEHQVAAAGAICAGYMVAIFSYEGADGTDRVTHDFVVGTAMNLGATQADDTKEQQLEKKKKVNNYIPTMVPAVHTDKFNENQVHTEMLLINQLVGFLEMLETQQGKKFKLVRMLPNYAKDNATFVFDIKKISVDAKIKFEHAMGNVTAVCNGCKDFGKRIEGTWKPKLADFTIDMSHIT